MMREKKFQSVNTPESLDAQQPSHHFLSTIVQTVLIALVVAATLWSQPLWAEDYLNSGKAYYQQHRYAEALIQFRNVLQLDPDSATAQLWLGKVYLANGQSKLALSSLEKAAKLNKLLVQETEVLKLQVYLTQGRYEEILIAASINSYGDSGLDAAAHATKGHALLGLNQIKDAQKAFLRALELKETNPEALVGMARIQFADNKYSQAQQHLDTVLEVDSKHIAALIFRGQMFAQSGNHKEAVVTFSQVISIQKGHLTARTYRADSYLANKEYEQANGDINAILQMDRTMPQAYFLRAKYHILLKQYSKAKTAAETAIYLAPNHQLSYLLAGYANMQTNNLEQAENNLKVFLNSIPHHKEARLLLAETYFRQQDPDSIIDLLTPVVEDGSDTSPLVSMLLGAAQIQTGDLTSGIKKIELALLENPEHDEFRTVLALGKMAQGGVERAIEELSLAAKKDSSTLSISFLAALHMRQGNFEKAEAVIDSYLNDNSTNLSAYRLRALLFEKSGNQDKAKETFSYMLTLDSAFIPAIEGLARIELSSGEIGSAEKLYSEVLKLDKNNLNALMELARISFLRGDIQEAVNWLSTAKTAAPESSKPVERLVSYYLSSGNKEKAVSEALLFYISNKNNASAGYNLARAYIASSEFKKAIQPLEKIVTNHPDNMTFGLLLTDVLMLLGDNESAFNNLKKMDSIFTDSLEVKERIAKIFILNGDHERAKSESIKIRSLWKGYSAAEQILGDIELNKGNFDSASLHYQFAFQTAPSPYLVEAIYASNMKLGRTKIALKAYKDYLLTAPENDLVRINYAAALLKLKMFDDATREYETLLSTQSGNITVLNNLAWLKCKGGNSECLGYAERALKLDSKNPSVLDTAGMAQLDFGAPEKGLKLIREAVLMKPDNPGLHLHLAIALKENGFLSEAIKELTLLVKYNKDYAGIDRAVALLEEYK